MLDMLPLAVFIVILVVHSVSSQDRVWTKLAGSGDNDFANGVATDQSSGDVYVAGRALESVNGQTYAGDSDIVILKYANDGTLQWTRMYGGTSYDTASAVAVDGINGYVFVTGSVTGNIHSQTNAGGQDIFLMKLTSIGTRGWTRLAGASFSDSGNAIAIESVNSAVYVTGCASDSVNGETFYGGGVDFILLKYDFDGNVVWTRMTGTGTSEEAVGVAVDTATYDVYITGNTGAALNGQSYLGGSDVVLLRYTSSGTLVWTKQVGSTASELSYAMGIDSTSGYVYVAGLAASSLYSQPFLGGSADMFLMQFNDTNGDLLWTRMAGSTAYDLAFAMTVSNNGYVYVAGSARGSVDGQTYLDSLGEPDYFMIKYASNGTKIWTRMHGTDEVDVATGIAVLNSNSNTQTLFICGSTKGDLDGETIVAYRDMFVSKYTTSEPLPPANNNGMTCLYRSFIQVSTGSTFTRYSCFKDNNSI